MIKAIVFDLDGTLLDTLLDLQKSVNFALKSLQFPEISYEHARVSIGNGTTMLMHRCTPKNIDEETQLKAFNLFSDYYSLHYNDSTKPYEGIANLLSKLKALGYKLGVISNKLDPKAKELVEFHFPNTFDAVQGTYLDKPKKPSKIITDMLLNSLGINGEEALYIGDTEVDLECAKNGNMKFILVGYGYRTIDELKKTCPTFKPITNFDDLFNQIIEYSVS